MMETQTVEFVTTTREIKESYSSVSFQLRMDRKYVWLQKIALWVLKKLGCYSIIREVGMVKHVIDTEQFMNKLLIQKRELVDLYHLRGEHLLVGYKEFKELTCIQACTPLSFTAPYMWSDGRRTDPFDLKVTIVPWMKGFLVLPRGFKDKGFEDQNDY